MAQKSKIVSLESQKGQEFAAAAKFAAATPKFDEIVLNGKVGTLIARPRGVEFRTLVKGPNASGSWRGISSITAVIGEMLKHSDANTILKVNDARVDRDEFRELVKGVGEGQVVDMVAEKPQPAPEGKKKKEKNPVSEDQVQQEAPAASEVEEAPKGEAEEILGQLAALGEEAFVEEPKAEEAAEEPKAEEKVEAKPKFVKKKPSYVEGKVMHKGEEVPACRICGKALTQEASIIRGIGPVCAAGMQKALAFGDEKFKEFVKDATDQEWLEACNKARILLGARDELSEPPKDYVKMGELWKMIKERDPEDKIKGSRFIRAFGGDRNANEPLHPSFQPVYVGRQRYMSLDALNHLDVLFEGAAKRELAGAAKAAAEKAKAKKDQGEAA